MPKFPLDEYKVTETLDIDVGTKVTIGREDRGHRDRPNGNSASVRYNMDIGDTYPKVGEITVTAFLNGKTVKETAEALIETLEHALATIKAQLSEHGVL